MPAFLTPWLRFVPLKCRRPGRSFAIPSKCAGDDAAPADAKIAMQSALSNFLDFNTKTIFNTSSGKLFHDAKIDVAWKADLPEMRPRTRYGFSMTIEICICVCYATVHLCIKYWASLTRTCRCQQHEWNCLFIPTETYLNGISGIQTTVLMLAHKQNMLRHLSSAKIR